MYTYSTWWCGMIRPSPTSSLFPYTTLFRSIQKAQIALALCDGKLSDEMEKTRAVAPALQKVVYWGSGQPDGLEALIADASPDFKAVDTASDDLCLIAFTSGTTGDPKGTMHFHRDMLAVCDGYARNV